MYTNRWTPLMPLAPRARNWACTSSSVFLAWALLTLALAFSSSFNLLISAICKRRSLNWRYTICYRKTARKQWTYHGYYIHKHLQCCVLLIGCFHSWLSVLFPYPCLTIRCLAIWCSHSWFSKILVIGVVDTFCPWFSPACLMNDWFSIYLSMCLYICLSDS